jgi:hypothetical protein
VLYAHERALAQVSQPHFPRFYTSGWLFVALTRHQLRQYLKNADTRSMTVTNRLHVRATAETCRLCCPFFLSRQFFCLLKRTQDGIMFRLGLNRPFLSNYAQVLSPTYTLHMFCMVHNALAFRRWPWRFHLKALMHFQRLHATCCSSQRTSHLTPYTSHLTPHTSHLTPHTSHLTPHTSHLTPHTSHLTPHTSHLTPPIQSLNETAAALCEGAGIGCMDEMWPLRRAAVAAVYAAAELHLLTDSSDGHAVRVGWRHTWHITHDT